MCWGKQTEVFKMVEWEYFFPCLWWSWGHCLISIPITPWILRNLCTEPDPVQRWVLPQRCWGAGRIGLLLLPHCYLGEQQGREEGMIERRGVRRRKGEEKIIRKPPLPSAIVLFTRRLPTELRCRVAGKHVITENTVSKGIFQALTAHKLQFVDFFLGLDLN